jgi:cell division protein FtsQ
MKQQVETPHAQSWLGIEQSVNTRTMTGKGMRRLGGNMVRGIFSLVVVGSVAASSFWLWRAFEKPEQTLAPVATTAPVREVVALTDGVLTRDWVRERIALPAGITLVAVDLGSIKAAVEKEGQVAEAVVSRDFPDTLVVTIRERAPVARVMAALDRAAPPESLLVGNDGVVFRGRGHDAGTIARLPWLDGIRLTRRGEDGFEPVDGVGRVCDLMLAMRRDAPHFIGRFQVVSLAEAPLLVVRMPEAREVVFEETDLPRQLARLDHILKEHARDAAAPRIERIDLSIAAQVTVRYASDSRAAGTPGSSFSLNRNLPSNNRTNNRGLQR